MIALAKRINFHLVISTLLCCIQLHAQQDDEYCIRLKEPSSIQFFHESLLDSVPKEQVLMYREAFLQHSKMLSRFGEEPLLDSTANIFRAVTLGAFNNPEDVRIFSIEKQNNQVIITVKFVNDIKRATVLVHKRSCGSELWDEFLQLADKVIVSQPPFKRSGLPVHDGATTVFEGWLHGKYHYVERHVSSTRNSELQNINHFLFRSAGDIYDVDCGKNMREN